MELEVNNSLLNWVLRIQNNGPGMSPEVLSNALLPFYATKHEGTGLGLALSRKNNRESRGPDLVTKRSAQGLVVQVLLPIVPPLSAK